MPKMKRGRTMAAFVELMNCKVTSQKKCDVRVSYKIHKPDGSLLATREVNQAGILWKKPNARRSYPFGLAQMQFSLKKDDPPGEYKVRTKVTDVTMRTTFEIELNFDLR